MRTERTDVLVIGSGFGAAAPALRLAEAGMRVIMVEKGPKIDPRRDFRMTQDPHYYMRYLKSVSGKHLGLTYAEALGGGSGFYEMASFRAPSLAFRQTDQHGYRLWPAKIDRVALDPYYALADRMLGVEQIPASEVPKNGLLFARMMRDLGYSCDRARYAVRDCVGAGYCTAGCVFGAKQSLLFNYLPQAVSLGATVLTDLEVREIARIAAVGQTREGGPIESVPYRYRVVCRSTNRNREQVGFEAKLVVLAAGTVGSARILLQSRRHLPLLSDLVGRNIAFNGSIKVAGLMPETWPAGDLYTGRSHAGMISYQFLESHGITVFAMKPLPLQVAASARLTLEGTPSSSYWGESNVRLMRQFRHRAMVLVALGMSPPVGRLELDGDDVRAEVDLSDELRQYHEDIRDLLHSLFRRSRCQVIETAFVGRDGMPSRDHHFSTAHQVGSCRMGESKSRGVVDMAGAVFDYPGLYITDGAAIPSSLAVNTAHTILANAERIAVGVRTRYGLARERVVTTR